jgi:hypothetical protein
MKFLANSVSFFMGWIFAEVLHFTWAHDQEDIITCAILLAGLVILRFILAKSRIKE